MFTALSLILSTSLVTNAFQVSKIMPESNAYSNAYHNKLKAERREEQQCEVEH